MSCLGESIGKLGFGLMRLPMLPNGEVDVEQVKQMADLFLSRGYTYFDTAYGYIGGKSEEAVKPVLVDRYPRESFQLATKLPVWAGAKTADDAKEMFRTSLRRTGAGYFDFYLLHNLGGERTKRFEELGVWEFCRSLKDQGLIRHLGFSFHDDADTLNRILDAHPETEFVQLQINYADWESDSVQSRKCYEAVRAHGLPVVVMEPVKGGTLARLPERAAKLFREADSRLSTASWALRYACSLEGLVTVLSGMSNLEQMEDNLSAMHRGIPLTQEERSVIDAVRTALNDVPKIPCTDCRYCMKGCPQQVLIPEAFKAMNNYLTFENLAAARGSYGWATHEGGKASLCVACGQCEQVCPQHIHIIDELKRVVATLERKD